MISSVWVSNPNSKSLSASSRIRYSTLKSDSCSWGREILVQAETFLGCSVDEAHGR